MNSRKYKILLPTCTKLKKREEEREELIDYNPGTRVTVQKEGKRSS